MTLLTGFTCRGLGSAVRLLRYVTEATVFPSAATRQPAEVKNRCFTVPVLSCFWLCACLLWIVGNLERCFLYYRSDSCRLRVCAFCRAEPNEARLVLLRCLRGRGVRIRLWGFYEVIFWAYVRERLFLGFLGRSSCVWLRIRCGIFDGVCDLRACSRVFFWRGRLTYS